MRVISTAAALAAALALPAIAGAAGAPAQLSWRSLGPAVSGGRVAAVAGTNADPALLYVGAAGGGVWKSTDAGQHWEPVFDAEGIPSIGAVAIDPRDERIVWVGTGEANPRNDVMQGDGVYLTADGAKTWKKVLPLQNSLVSSILIDPRDPQRVLVGVLGDAFADTPDRGVYRTADGGKTWTKTLYLAPDSGVCDMAMDPAAPDVVYAGMWEFRRTGWSLQSGGAHDGLFKSTDGGATWSEVRANGLPAGELGRIAVAIAPSNPKRIYALIQSKEGLLWRSDDAGASWAMVGDDPLVDERPFYFSHIFVDPLDQDKLWSVSVHLTVSTDGGKHFTTTGQGLHGDHHAMWIAADGKRIVEGNDGGVALSFDDGASWRWDKNLPISQLYHIGYSSDRHYIVCAPLQDNGTWCAPSDPLDPQGLSASQWLFAGSGDGTWAVVDPADAGRVWESFAGSDDGGDVYVHDFGSGETRSVAPYLRDQNVVPPAQLRYRFNWETPIAFDPFDSHRTYVGANVLFTSTDGGYDWTALGGDLTRNDRAHQQMTGGLTLDGTGAETSDTILSIEPSRAARGEIWVGTDDGLVQLTRDGGTHWRNVTPAGIAPYGRFDAISASPSDAGTAYAAYDAHMIGDRTPYLFVTTDYGARWRPIAAGLPADDEVRSVLVDPHDPALIFAGTDRSLWASWNRGASWERIEANLPPASYRDIRLQPSTDDLLVATHGRGAFVLDDASALEELGAARAAGTFLFAVRDAIAWNLNGYWGTGYDGEAPPYGAIVTYYLRDAAAHAPTAEILDARGTVVRTFTTHEQDGKDVADLSNDAGLDRFDWDLTGQPATPWTFAPEWNAGNAGIPVPPGRYVVRLHAGNVTLQRPILVRADPRLHYPQADYEATYALQQRLLGDFSRLDAALNVLSTVAKEAPLRAAALRQRDAALSADAAKAGTQASALIATITSNPQNDQDDDFLEDQLRERIQGVLGSFVSFSRPTQAQRQECDALHALTEARLAAYRSFAAALGALDAGLRAQHLPPVRQAAQR